MSLSPCQNTQTVAPHPGLHSPSFSALIGSAPVTNQRRYKSPGLSPCKPRSIVVVIIIFSHLAISSRLSFHGLFSHLAPLRITFATDRPSPASRTSIEPRPNIPVCCCFDPACLTMYLSRPFNKSLRLDPLASRLTHSVTEYSVTTGSSSFTPGQSTGMDSDRILFRLKQGPRSLEQYIREFLAIANYSTLPDCIIIEIFCDGVNEPLKARLRREGQRSSLAAFMDFALMCVGSSFTVGVAEEQRDITVTPAAQPARQMAAAPVRAHKMAATAEPVHKMAATAVPVRKMAAKTELRHVTAATPEPNKAKAAFPESSQVAAVFPEFSQVAAVFPES
ncbi:hypothetical protein M9458_000110, partial [Cirrhinus mrigala]